MRSLVWFRSDLRTRDNTALHNARRDSVRGVVGLFVISPDEWRSHDYAPARIDLMLRTLRELSASLAALNIPLRIANAPSAAQVPALVLAAAKEHACDALHFNREYEVDESRRDEETQRLFVQSGRRVEAWHDQSVVAPGELRTGEGRFYTVFTPFKKAWIRRVTEQDGVRVLPAPARQDATGIDPSPVPDTVPGFESRIDPALWPAGEKHAASTLSRFAQKRMDSYKAQRDLPAQPGTSTLSPYLAIGAISPRQCIAEAVAANAPRTRANPLDSGSEGIACWISEVVWREFYIHITAGFPRVCMNRAFQPQTDRLEWSGNTDHFEAWKAGRTGVPIVDAGMRQLAQTGWMHNRVRMIAAMYLTKNLFINWRWGEQWFMRNLVDGFFASNNGGWQWSASTGTDAAPYFRVFNPVSQSRKFDPAGEYIRRHVPELASLGDDDIHEPWTLPELARSRLDYPAPLVDLSESRESAIKAFQALRAG